jgi:hypothetical protein
MNETARFPRQMALVGSDLRHILTIRFINRLSCTSNAERQCYLRANVDGFIKGRFRQSKGQSE